MKNYFVWRRLVMKNNIVWRRLVMKNYFCMDETRTYLRTLAAG